MKIYSPLEPLRGTLFCFFYSMKSVVVHGNCDCGCGGVRDDGGDGARDADCGGGGEDGDDGDGGDVGAGVDAEGFGGHGSDGGGEDENKKHPLSVVVSSVCNVSVVETEVDLAGFDGCVLRLAQRGVPPVSVGPGL